MKILKLLVFIFLCSVYSKTGFSISNKYWGYCKGNKAYSDKLYKVEKPEAHWLCKLPTGKSAGASTQGTTNRCIPNQGLECQIGAGGVKGPGDNNVPKGAWYYVGGFNAAYPMVKCQCGCFTGDMRLLTSQGEVKFNELEAFSLKSNHHMMTFDHQSNDVAKKRAIAPSDLVVGPELEEIYRFSTERSSIEVTHEHPVVIERNGNKLLVQARSVSYTDHLLNKDGEKEEILGVERFFLPDDDNLVFNIDTKESNESDHIIIVNGYQMGDLYWQNELSERESRIENLLK